MPKGQDQERMVGLLETFSRHTEECIPMFQEKGISLKMLGMIAGFTNDLKTADRKQEIAKDISKNLTAEAYM